ncbi:unnamed protein product [Vitrella brassicaformis CCMP3155]|uniref:NADH-cytochrome b5 reductase n=2 Tax=Vitrella brassicaformis TaxID=1169539 RepID=A0A0G4ENY6_VITBC|nr:unnamed protein product [Vitrella brassicaformis CCMP3155]|eukprot:CEL99134.1 unnamed protein product [Vitrella brassicaformis CCMP3155]
MSDSTNGSTLPLVAAAGAGIACAVGIAAYIYHQKTKTKKFLNKERQKVTLIDKIIVSHDTRKFRLGLPGKNYILGLPIGKHFKLFAPNMKGKVEGEWNKRPDPEAGKAEIERKYTPVTGDETPGHVDLMIKVYRGGEKDSFPDGGKMSQYLESLEIGDTIDMMGPIGMIEYKGNGLFTYGKKQIPKKKIGMMAGGTGITPMLQVIQAVLADPNDPTQLSLIFANQTEEDILVRDMLEAELQKHPDRFKLWYTLDRPPSAGWKYSSGFITKEMIQEHLPPPAPDTLILMCGPPPMIKYACKANLEALGYPKEDMLEF